MERFQRSCYCGQVNSQHIGQQLTLVGWIKKIRDHGQILFMDIRDKTGYAQVVFEDPSLLLKSPLVKDPSISPAKSSQKKEKLKTPFPPSPPSSPSPIGMETVVMVQGRVRKRPEGMIHPKIATGEVELVAQFFEVLSLAKTPPFVIDDPHVSEELALKYRYLDLRSQRLQKNLKLAHKVYQTVRQVLSDKDFIEVSTPVLYKPTPEGARDFLVPSRQRIGSCYALVQSPQILKQLLMVGAVDRYFQLAPCFRDEDLRSDRQPEFQQIDIEMSFVTAQEVLDHSQHLVQVLWKKFKNQQILTIPSLSYDEALKCYGTDRPDLRNPLKFQDISQDVKNGGVALFEQVLDKKGHVQSLFVPQAVKPISSSQLKKYDQEVKNLGLGGLIWIQKEESKTGVSKKIFRSNATKMMPPPLLETCWELGLKKGSLPTYKDQGVVFILAGGMEELAPSKAFLIHSLGKLQQLIDMSHDRFCWVRDFPLLEYDSQLQRWKACHHPFTAPVPEDIPYLMKQELVPCGRPLKAEAYDLVCNGQELAGGSLRIHQAPVQEALFQALSLSPQQCQEKFGFFLEALKYGTPPHGGIAWGMERLLMLLIGTEHIRDVVAFPKTNKGLCLMSEAPSLPAREHLLELGIQFIHKQSVK